MRFSIRSLLAIMLLCAIAFPLLIGLREVRREEAMRVQLHLEIETLRTNLALDDPDKQRIREHQRDEYAALRELRVNAEQHFETIQAKYGKIEVRGPDVLSLRTVPQLSVDQTQPPTVFRMLVPNEREVWLKYAVIAGKRASRSPEQLDQILESPANSGFELAGPYEVRLHPGQQDLRIQTGPVDGNILSISVGLSDRVLLDTQFSGDGAPSTGSFHISGLEQLDFAADRQLPWLLNFDVTLRHDDGTNRHAPFDGCLWLSDRSSGYDGFPDEAKQQ